MAIRRVDPVTARKGTFVQSFDRPEELEFWSPRLEKLKQGRAARGELVYAIVQLGAKVGKPAAASWQVFLLADRAS
jgi:hypothetical protein